MRTEATWAMWIDCSSFPTHWGVKWTTLVGDTATCVGSSRLPGLRRLARKTSPSVNGRARWMSPKVVGVRAGS